MDYADWLEHKATSHEGNGVDLLSEADAEAEIAKVMCPHVNRGFNLERCVYECRDCNAVLQTFEVALSPRAQRERARN